MTRCLGFSEKGMKLNAIEIDQELGLIAVLRGGESTEVA